MKNFLNQIVGNIQQHRQHLFKQFSHTEFKKQLPNLIPNRYKPKEILEQVSKKFFLIAECKHASPSKGILCQNYSPIKLAHDYERGGASAVSILIEEKFFMGSPEHLQAVRSSIDLPLLWKDFIIHEEQIALARTSGADMLLLIFRILEQDQITRFVDFSLQCGLLPLVEIFVDDDITQLAQLANSFPSQFLIGINNRNLITFNTDINNSQKMYNQLSFLHDKFLFISESGIKNSEDIHRLKKIGYSGALVGESLIKEVDQAVAIKKLLL